MRRIPNIPLLPVAQKDVMVEVCCRAGTVIKVRSVEESVLALALEKGRNIAAADTYVCRIV